MKKIVTFLILLLVTANFAIAQAPPASKPDVELTEEEAKYRIDEFQARVNDLQSKLQGVTNDVEKLKENLTQTNKNLEDCRKELLALIGATEADVEAFRQKLGVIEGKVREYKGYSNDRLADMRDQIEALENDLNELRTNKIALLPEFFNKIQQLGRDIKGLYREKKITTYTVGTWAEDRDCLWNIAGKMQIYGDPFMWPKIWASNQDLIRNPDIIQPGWVLQVPPKGPKSPETLKMERKYYREKREKMEEMEGTEEQTANQPTKGE